MTVRTASIPLIILFLLVIAASANFNTFLHNFLSTELHPQESNHLLIGSTTAFLTLLLVASLFALTRKLSQEVQAKKFELSAMYEENSFFRLLSEKSNDMVHLNDLTGTIVYVNPVTIELLGHEHDEIVNKSADNFIHPEDREKICGDMDQVAQGGTRPPREIRLLKKNGDYLEVEAKGFALDTDGEKKYIGAILRDVSKRKNNVRQLKAQEEWDQTFNTMTDLVSVHDRDFKVINANSALCEFLDKNPEEILGKLCYQLFHNSNEPFADCPHKKAREIGNAASEVINDPDIGVPLRITCSPFFDADGEFQGSVHIARITDPADQVNDNEERMIPVCASCKDIRKEDGEWMKIEHFFMNKFDVQFTHSVCQKCQKKLYPEFIDL